MLLTHILIKDVAKWDFKNLYFAKEEQRVDVAAFNQVDLFSDLKINNFFPREKEVKKRRETKLNWEKNEFSFDSILKF